MARKFRKRLIRGHVLLTKSEIDTLRLSGRGYGCFIDMARKAEMHPNTMRYILDRGYGRLSNVIKIRERILGKYENSPH